MRTSAKTLLISIFSAALMAGGVVAQDTAGSSPAQTQPQAPSAGSQTPDQLPAAQTSAPAAAPQTQAPQPSAAAAQPGAIKRVAPGSVIPVQLTKTIDAKKAKTGDEVLAKVTQDLKSNSGEVVFAKDTKVVGHVTESQPRSKDQKESQVGIMFDRAVTKGGDMQLPMSIQAVIGPQNPNADQGSSQTAPTAGTARPSGMSGANQAQPPTAAPGTGDSTAASSTAAARPQITGNTQGVVGISDLNLAAASDATQGSVLTSEKNNVKLESGTLMLLRVNP